MAKAMSEEDRARFDVRLSFLDENDPEAKPPLSEEEAQRLIDAIESGLHEMSASSEVAMIPADCTYENCGKAAAAAREIAAAFDVKVSCHWTCMWTWSRLGGWKHECYFRCSSSGGMTIEGTASTVS